MIESQCPICSSPVLPSHAYCGNCGAALAGAGAGSEVAAVAAPEVSSAASLDPAVGVEPYEDPSLTAAAETAATTPERLRGDGAPPSPRLEPSPWVMNPSGGSASPPVAGPSMSLRVGATPMSLVGHPPSAWTPPNEAAPGPAVEPVPEAGTGSTPVTDFAASSDAPSGASSDPDWTLRASQGVPPPPAPPAPFVTPAPWAQPAPVAQPPAPPSYVVQRPPAPASPFSQPAPIVPATPVATAVTEPPSRPTAKESIPELVAFGLVAAGAVIGILSLFLPWAGVTGIGIGTESIAGSPPPPNQWGWGMPAGFPLFLLSLPVLVAAAGSDRAQQRFPRLASVIGRVTDLILPMILGGLYLGVVFMYMTVPAGYGPGLYSGQSAIVVAAGLLIAGAIVTIFFPPEVEVAAG